MEFKASNGNYIPFRTMLWYFSGRPTWGVAVRNIIGNILLFFPVGFFCVAFFRRTAWYSVFVVAFLLSISFETIQGATGSGIVDVDDLILNVLGAIIGYLALKIIGLKIIK